MFANRCWMALGLMLGMASLLPAQDVLTGIDVLRRDQFAILKGAQVALITNHTGLTQDGVSTVKLFAEQSQLKLVALFSPEHGFAGQLDVSHIGDSKDATTGLTIYSLYGATRKPTAEMLKGVDTIVFDIQDIGCRFYTYNSTMAEAMKAAAEHKLRFVVLDRPNPIGGLACGGPILDGGKESFVGVTRLPIRHGLTTGEIAQLVKTESQLDVNLVVVPCEGWQRSQLWDETGLIWTNPSPNMRSLTQALLYPAIGTWEFTDISVGRGTDTPFEVLGAPYIDARQLARDLNARQIPGLRCIPIQFTPSSSKFEKKLCHGVNFVIVDRENFDPNRLCLELAVVLKRSYPEKWKPEASIKLLGNQQVLTALNRGASPEALQELAAQGLDEYRQRRAKVLLYPE